MTLAYGWVVPPADLEPATLPPARGPVTARLFDALARPVHTVAWSVPDVLGDPLRDDDTALALYALYELHYRGFEMVEEEWEWEPSLLAVRRVLEDALLARLREVVGRDESTADVVGALYEMLAGGGRSLSAFLATRGTLGQMREFAVHRSAYQLKEADPHSWAIPRMAGGVKAALVEVQADEYGEGRQRDMHQNLFALTMRALGLDVRYGAYLDLLPAATLAAVNVVSFFGLHRRWRGALVGHLALFEMTSVEPMGRYSQALRRLGFGPAARHFFEVHVVADAHHERLAAHELAGGLAAQDPRLSADIVFGARCCMAVECAFADAVLDAWETGRTSLRRPVTLPAAAAGPR